jgi:hypothetical protein
MNRLALWLGLCILVGWAPPAQSANWLKNCQTTASAPSQSLSPGQYACNVPTSATDNSSGLLSVDGCENIDIFFYPDFDGDAVASGGTGQMRNCPTTGISTANGGAGENACWVMENLLFDGVPATNSEAIYGIAANWIFWEQVAYTVTTEPIRVIVRCNGPTH